MKKNTTPAEYNVQNLIDFRVKQLWLGPVKNSNQTKKDYPVVQWTIAMIAVLAVLVLLHHLGIIETSTTQGL